MADVITKVTNAMIDTDAIAHANMANDAIGHDEMRDNAIGNAEMRDDAINTAEIVNGAVTADKLATTLDLSGKTLTLRGGWTYGSQVATTSGTTVELSAAIPSWVTEVEILLNGVSTNTINQPPLIQLGDAGGYETASYVAGVAVIEATNAGETDITAGFEVARASDYAATDEIHGVVRLTRWDAAEHLWLASGIITASGAEMHFLSGSKTLSDALTSIRLNTPGGAATFDAGEARIRYR